MKKRILALLMAVCMIASLLPATAMTVFAADEAAGPAKFAFSDNTAPSQTPEIVKTINQGDTPIYLYAKNTVSEGAGESDYNIKITYNVGENPKLYLRGAVIKSRGMDDVSPIIIGDSADATYNNVAVDIVIEEGNSQLTWERHWAPAAITSYITKQLTFTKSENGGTLRIEKNASGNNGHGINAVGDVLLMGANITMVGMSIYGGTNDRGHYINSSTGNITVDGGSLTITTRAVTDSNENVLNAAKDIVFQNNANVSITVNKNGTTVLNAGGKVVINNATVDITINDSTATSKVAADTVPFEVQGYALGYKAKIDGTEYDSTNFADALASNVATCTSLSIEPIEPPKMEFNFAISPGAMGTPYVIEQGDDPIYLKTVFLGNSGSGIGKWVASEEGANAGDYQIMLSFPTGGKPTLTLNGATFGTGDPATTSAIVIGSATGDSVVNGLDVDVQIIANTKFQHCFTYGGSAIKSYIEGDLTINGNGGKVFEAVSQGNMNVIDAVGNVKLVDVDMRISHYHQGYKSSYIYTSAGDITVSGGKLTLATSRASTAANAALNAPAGAVTIENGANVTITANGTSVGINAANGTTIKDSSVTITTASGTLYNTKPVADFTDPRYVLVEEDGSYTIKPYVPPKMEFNFAVAPGAMGEAFTITEGGDPVYVKNVTVNKGIAGTTEGASASDYQVMFSFPAGGKPTVTLNGANFNTGDPGTTFAIVIGSASGDAVINAQDVVIEVIANSTFSHWTGYAGGAIMSYVTGDLTVNGNGKTLTLNSRAHRSYPPAGMVAVTGNLEFVNTNVVMKNGDNATTTGSNFVNSTNGNITINGGAFTATTAPATGCQNMAILNASNGAVVIKNGAVVNITVNSNTTGIKTKDGATVKDSTLNLKVTGEGTLYNTKPVADFTGGKYNLTEADGSYSISPYIPPAMQFAFADGARTTNLVKEITVGADPIYLKTVGNFVVDEGDEEDYQIMITFPEDGKPTLYLNGAYIRNGDATGYDLVIGYAEGSVMNDLDVDIIITKNTTFYQQYNWAVPNIVSYIEGDLTFTSDGGSFLLQTMSHGRTMNSAIYATGNVKFVNANVGIHYAATKTMTTDYVYSAKGNIVVSGGSLTIGTDAGANADKAALKAPNGTVTIENGAVVNIDLNNAGTGILAGKGIFFADSEITINNEKGTLFNAEPNLSGFTKEYTVINADGVYKVTMACQHEAGEVVVENEVAADCDTAGSYENVTYCAKCGEEMSRETVAVDALGHNYESVVTAPTCTTAGYTTHTCTVCGNSYADSNVAALGHTNAAAVKENEVAPDCVNAGSYESVVYCSVCNVEVSRETVTVDALGHTAGEVVIENEVAAQMNVKGSYDEVVYCTVCGAELSRVTKYTDALTGAVEIDGYYYNTLAEAVAAAEAGDEIILHADQTADAIITITKSITINGNGKTLTSTAARAINFSGANGVTIKNLTVNASGERAFNVIESATNITLENVTATAKNYTVNIAASAPNAVVAIKNSTLNGLCTVNVAAAGAQATVDNSTINCNDNNTTVGESYAALSLNKVAVGGSIVATNSTINVAAGSDSYKGRNGAENGTVTIDGSTEGVQVIVAVITYPGSDYYHAFTSLADAIEFAKAGNAITLIRDITASEIITIDKSITINGDGKTLTSSAARAINIDTTGAVEINGLTINAAERAVNIINQAATVTLNNVTATANNNAAYIATSAGAAKLTINNSNLTGLAVVNVAGAGSEVEINNTKITNVDANKDEDYGAITVWTSAASATVAVNGGEIIVAGDSHKAAIFPANATVTGVDDIIYMVALVGDAGFTTLAEAIEYAKAGATIELVRDVTSEVIDVVNSDGAAFTAAVFINKNITLNGNGRTIYADGCKYGIYTYGGTIKNVTVVGASRAIFADANVAYDIVLDNVKADGDYAFNVTATVNKPAGKVSLTVKNSELKGWLSYSDWCISTAAFENCAFAAGTNENAYNTFVAYVATTISGTSTFEDGYKLSVAKDSITIAEGIDVSGVVIADGCHLLNNVVEKHTFANATCTAPKTCVCGATEGEALGHTASTAVEENKVDATCTAEGSYDEVVYCSVCGTEMSRTPKTIDKLPHTAGAAVEENKVDATCATEGSYDEVVYCSVCGTEMSRTPKTIDKLPHTAGTAVEENKVDATCTAEGSYDEVVYCSVCGTEMSRTPKTIDKLSHTAGEVVVENATDATCTTAGSYDNVTYCTVCEAELSRETITVDALGHTAGEVVVENFKDSDLNDEGSYDNVIYCTVCGAEISREAVTIPVKTGAVAELNGVKYATLAEAVNVANGIKTPCEIKLLANSRGDGLTFRREVTVDFGSYYYIANNFATGTSAAVRVAAGATVTFTGTGTLATATADREKFSTLIVNSGDLIIDGIKVNGNNLRDPNFNNYYAIRNLADDATVQILSGSVTATDMEAAYTVNLTGTTTKAADVEIKIPTHWCWVNGTTLSHEHNYTVTFVGATLETEGGYVHECQGCGYVRMTNTYNYYRGVARVGEYYYRTLQEAIDNANGGEVVLVKNVTIDVLAITESVTINQDRYHIIVNVSSEATPSAAVTIASGATLTLKGTGKLTNRASTSKQFDTLILNEGTFILDGVTLRADYLDKADECYVVAGNGTVEFLSGGVIMNRIPTNGIPGAA